MYTNFDAESWLNRITDHLKGGGIVDIVTATKCIRITQHTADKWAKMGLTLFKVKGNSLYLTSGKNSVCIDHCRITLH